VGLSLLLRLRCFLWLRRHGGSVVIGQRKPGWLVGMLTAVALALPATAESHVKGCHSRACDRRQHAKRAAHWCRTHAVCLWRHRWNNLPSGERSWARCIADHETRGYPWSVKARVATGNGYYGSTQWLPATWHSAGGSGLPTDHTLYEQLVRTVWWAHIAGSSQWSTSRYCGGV
jgi:hypothetical protein